MLILTPQQSRLRDKRKSEMHMNRLKKMTLKEILNLGRQGRLTQDASEYLGFKFNPPSDSELELAIALGVIPRNQADAYRAEIAKKVEEFYSNLVVFPDANLSFLHRGKPMQLEDTFGREFKLDKYAISVLNGVVSIDGKHCAHIPRNQINDLMNDTYDGPCAMYIFIDPCARPLRSLDRLSLSRTIFGDIQY